MVRPVFGSKFVILEALTLAFGDKVRFDGRFDGMVTLVVVILAMLLAEEAIARLYRRLGGPDQNSVPASTKARTAST